jgi:hypothetical protein
LLRRAALARKRFATATAEAVDRERNLNSVSQVVSYSGVFGAIKTFPKRRPFATNLWLTVTLFPLADMNMQLIEGGVWDPRRTALFLAFGLYNGMMWWIVYVRAFSRVFPKAVRFSNLSWAEKLNYPEGAKQFVAQICTDLFVYVPLWYWPSFYFFKSRVQGESLWSVWNNFTTNFIPDNTAQLSYWIPGDILMFAAPAWMRLPISHAVNYGWNVGVSFFRSHMDE